MKTFDYGMAFSRNLGWVTEAEQEKLRNSRVAIGGMGGVGGVHLLTGPVCVEGAEPGDMLEVRVIDIGFRVPYGVNSAGPGSGVLPDFMPTRLQRVIRLDSAGFASRRNRRGVTPLVTLVNLPG